MFRLGVFVDYAYLYATARRCFPLGEPAATLPPWYGNVPPQAIAAALTRRPPPWIRRSERHISRVGVVLPRFDEARQPMMQRRVAGWREARVDVQTSPPLPGSAWRGARAVRLAMMATAALERGECNMVVLVSGELSLLPLVNDLLGDRRDTARIELMSWVSAAGESFNTLASAAPQAWCHRLGPEVFSHVAEKPSKPTPRRKRHRAGTAVASNTAMAEAFRVARRKQETQPIPDQLPEAEAAPSAEAREPRRAPRWQLLRRVRSGRRGSQ
jgi:hypothetical protein